MLGNTLSTQLLSFVLILISLTLTAQSLHTAWMMLYAWEDASRWKNNRAPDAFIAPRLSFTILLPARHEEAVIQGTIQRVVNLRYPRHLVQVLVVIEAGDSGTISKVLDKIAELEAQGIHNVRLITFKDKPINKPHGLNLGLREATGDVVTVFDAEDEPHPYILNMINTVMVQEKAPVVQAGVQLMNFKDTWFSALNVLEYFFWFKSRLHYHATLGMVPLGGNTIFMWRELLQKHGGWDQNNLTEDADIGIRLSASGVPIRVVYDDRFVTREETPPTAAQFVKQRTRWTQGFMQVLKKGVWMRLPTMPQRMLAFYTLGFPFMQALLMLYIPVSVYLMLFVKLPDLVALITTLPLYMVLVQYAINVIGLFEFGAVQKLKVSPLWAFRLMLFYLPFQWMINFAALRAVWRELLGINNWEKTAHTGALRGEAPASPSAPASGRAAPAPVDGRLTGSRTPALIPNTGAPNSLDKTMPSAAAVTQVVRKAPQPDGDGSATVPSHLKPQGPAGGLTIPSRSKGQEPSPDGAGPARATLDEPALDQTRPAHLGENPNSAPSSQAAAPGQAKGSHGAQSFEEPESVDSRRPTQPSRLRQMPADATETIPYLAYKANPPEADTDPARTTYVGLSPHLKPRDQGPSDQKND